MTTIRHTLLLTLPLILSIATSAFAQQTQDSSTLPPTIAERIKEHAPDRLQQWEALYQASDAQQQPGIAFQLANMPLADLQELDVELLRSNTEWAYQVWNETPWKDAVPESVFLNDVLPYANIDETRESWREDFHKQFSPLVAECRTPGEAAQVLNREIFNKVGVHYSTARKKANQSPSESIQQGKASCTGLSILLVDACRSVGVPARLAGIPSWVNKRGNHTWVEVWDQGQWHFTGADEYTDQGLNHTWFQGDAKLAKKDQRMNSIYAVSFRKTETRFPMVWSRDGSRTVYAENVTDRYTGSLPADASGQKLRVRVWNADRSERVEAKVSLKCEQCVGEEPLRGESRGNRADMNDLLEFPIVPGRTYQLLIEHNEQSVNKSLKVSSAEDVLEEIILPEGEK